MNYTDFLKQAYNGLKIIIFGDLNLKKLHLRRGTRKYSHDWSFNRGGLYSVTDYYLCMGPGEETLVAPENACFSNADHRMMKLSLQVNWETTRKRKKLESKQSRMRQAVEAIDKARDASDFIRMMKVNSEPKFINVTMTVPKLVHSLELSQARDLRPITIMGLTKYKESSMLPNKIKTKDGIVEDSCFANVIAANVLKGAAETTSDLNDLIYLPRDVDLTNIPKNMSKKKAMGPDLIPDAIFSGEGIDNKRDIIIKDFLKGPILSSHCRSRLILLNKAKDPVPDVGDLRPITIMGTMQKLLEISIVHHLKLAMTKTSPFQFGFKNGTGTGEAMMRLNMRIKNCQRIRSHLGYYSSTSRKRLTR